MLVEAVSQRLQTTFTQSSQLFAQMEVLLESGSRFAVPSLFAFYRRDGDRACPDLLFPYARSMNNFFLTNQDAALLTVALDQLALQVQPGPNFYEQSNTIDDLMSRIEAAMGRNRAQLRKMAWERSPSPQVADALAAIERELIFE